MDLHDGVPKPEVENKDVQQGLNSVASGRTKPKRIVLWILWGVVVLGVLILLFGTPLLFGTRHPYTKRIPLSERVVVSEQRVIETASCIMMVCHGFPPVPIRVDYVISKSVEVDGKPTYSYDRYSVFHLSPDQQHLAVEDGMQGKPIEVLGIVDGSKVFANAPQEIAERHEEHYCEYPFKFARWTDGGKSFLVEMAGTYVNKDRDLIAYRELWRVDAHSAIVSFDRRDEKPWSYVLKWEDAPD
jgi:hypothetical protein